MNHLSKDQFRAILLKNKEPDAWYPFVEKYLSVQFIDTPNRIAMFLAQTIHESAYFTRLEENLNYSKEGLMKIFRKYFPNEQIAQEYARKPEKIANRVYANRMGNGDEASGDGWRYRGKGLIQLTGKNNCEAFRKWALTGKSLEECVAYLSTKEGAVHSAIWFWEVNNLNRFADTSNIIGCTQKINGGQIGIEERTHEFRRILNIIK